MGSQSLPSKSHPSNVVEFMKALKNSPLIPPPEARSKIFERSPQGVNHLRDRVKDELLEYKGRLETDPMAVKKELEMKDRWKYYVPVLSSIKAHKKNEHTAPGG